MYNMFHTKLSNIQLISESSRLYTYVIKYILIMYQTAWTQQKKLYWLNTEVVNVSICWVTKCSHLEMFVLHSTENLQGTVGNATQYEIQFVNYAPLQRKRSVRQGLHSARSSDLVLKDWSCYNETSWRRQTSFTETGWCHSDCIHLLLTVVVFYPTNPSLKYYSHLFLLLNVCII